MIGHALCLSFKLEILQGIHQPSDLYRIALYTRDASLNEQTTVYQTRGEVFGPGYDPGGQTLQGYRATLVGKVACLNWNDPVWPMASITARGALIYNYTKQNRAVAVIDLERDYTSTNGAFMIALPTDNALVSIN